MPVPTESSSASDITSDNGFEFGRGGTHEEGL